MMYAQQVSGPQLPHLSSQGVTLDDFQGTFWLRCSVSMNQLPKLVSFVWVIETMATKLSFLTRAFVEGLCHPPPGPCPRLGSQGTPRDIPEGWCDCCTTKWDSPFYLTRGERVSTGRCKVGIGVNMAWGLPAHRVPSEAFFSLCSGTPGDPWTIPPRPAPTSGPAPAGDLALWPQSRKPVPQGAFHVPGTVALTLGCPWPSPILSPLGEGGVIFKKSSRERQSGVGVTE